MWQRHACQSPAEGQPSHQLLSDVLCGHNTLLHPHSPDCPLLSPRHFTVALLLLILAGDPGLQAPPLARGGSLLGRRTKLAAA